MGSKYEAPEGPDIKELLKLTKEQHSNQLELVNQAQDFFTEQFEKQRDTGQGVIDLQEEIMRANQEFAQAQQDRYKKKGEPAQDAAASALGNIKPTDEEKAYLEALQDAKQSGDEEEYLSLLRDFETSVPESNYLAALTSYEDPEQLDAALNAMVEYDTPEEMQTAIDELQNYDSASRLAEVEGRAAADVMQSADASREAALRDLESYGIDPSQMAHGALDKEARANASARAAMASGQARRDTQLQGLSAQTQAGQLAAQSQLQKLGTNLQGAMGLTESQMRQLGMLGQAAGESRLQDDRELGAAGQAAGLGQQWRQEQLAMLGQAAGLSDQQMMQQLAGLTDAYNLYAGNPANSATAFGTSLNSGNSATSNAGALTSGGMAGYGGLSGMYGQAGQGLQGGYGVANSIYGNNISNAQASAEAAMAPMDLAAGVAGGAMGMMSFNEGGLVDPAMSPSGGAIPDDVPAAVSADEYVVPKEVLRWKGQEFFENLSRKSRAAQGLPDPTQQGGAPQSGQARAFVPDQALPVGANFG